MIPAVVTAGGRLSGDLAARAGSEIKALASVGGSTVLARVLSALEGSPQVGQVVVVGPREPLLTHVGERVCLIDEGTGGIDKRPARPERRPGLGGRRFRRPRGKRSAISLRRRHRRPDLPRPRRRRPGISASASRPLRDPLPENAGRVDEACGRRADGRLRSSRPARRHRKKTPP